LFDMFGSLVEEPKLAVLTTNDDELNVTAVVLMVMVTKPPTLTEPKLQLTVPAACVHVPCVVETETNVTWLGRGSETFTFCATAGPLLVTCSV
jgi:hypothetical protein